MLDLKRLSDNQEGIKALVNTQYTNKNEQVKSIVETEIKLRDGVKMLILYADIEFNLWIAIDGDVAIEHIKENRFIPCYNQRKIHKILDKYWIDD